MATNRVDAANIWISSLIFTLPTARSQQHLQPAIELLSNKTYYSLLSARWQSAMRKYNGIKSNNAEQVCEGNQYSLAQAQCPRCGQISSAGAEVIFNQIFNRLFLNKLSDILVHICGSFSIL